MSKANQILSCINWTQPSRYPVNHSGLCSIATQCCAGYVSSRALPLCALPLVVTRSTSAPMRVVANEVANANCALMRATATTTSNNNNNNRNVKWKLATTRKNIREIKTKLRFTWLFQLQWGLFAQVYLGLVYSLLSLATSWAEGEGQCEGKVQERGVGKESKREG